MSNCLIANARLVDPAGGIDARRDVLVAEGRILAVQERIAPDEVPAAVRGAGLGVVDAEGLWLWPGLIDAHVHLREPGFTHKETIATGGAAAAAGGFTTVVCEPNTDPPIDGVEIVRELAARAVADSPVNVRFKAAMTRGRRGAEPVDVDALAAEPAVVALSDDGDPVLGPAVMERVCRLAARAGLVVSPHCEDSARALAAFAGGADPGFRPGEPFTNEPQYIRRDIAIAGRCGCRIHFSHVSTAASVTAILAGREAHGAECVTWEVTPHHLLLSAEDYEGEAVPLVNPPLRPRADREALRRALLAGQVDAVADDHAPHAAAEKAAGACGLIGLETTLGLVLSHFVGEGALSPADAVRLMSVNPARIFGLPGGHLAPGARADLVLIDPAMEWTVDARRFRSLSRNTPYDGWRLRGRAVATYVAGRQVFAAEEFAARLSP